jgi:hypothetical protein
MIMRTLRDEKLRNSERLKTQLQQEPREQLGTAPIIMLPIARLATKKLYSLPSLENRAPVCS